MPGFELGFVVIGLALAGAGFFFWKKQKDRRDRKEQAGPPGAQTVTVAVPPLAAPREVLPGGMTPEQFAALAKAMGLVPAPVEPKVSPQPEVEILRKMAGDGASKFDFTKVETTPAAPEPPAPVYTAPEEDPIPPWFNEAYYLAANPDVAAAVGPEPKPFRRGYDHYRQHGKAELRSPMPPPPVTVPPGAGGMVGVIGETLAQYALRTSPQTGFKPSELGSLLLSAQASPGVPYATIIANYMKRTGMAAAPSKREFFGLESYPSAAALLADLNDSSMAYGVNLDGKELKFGDGGARFGPFMNYVTFPDGSVHLGTAPKAEVVSTPAPEPRPHRPAAAGLGLSYPSVAALIMHAEKIRYGFAVLVDDTPVIGGYADNPPANYRSQPDGSVVRG
jgi:hypothetical protein